MLERFGLARVALNTIAIDMLHSSLLPKPTHLLPGHEARLLCDRINQILAIRPQSVPLRRRAIEVAHVEASVPYLSRRMRDYCFLRI